MTTSEESLAEALARHELSVPPEAVAPLEKYCRLLWEWNEKLNLTRHTNFDLFVGRDLRDTLQLAEHVPPNVDVLDVGTGGGVPGVVLAILRPDLEVAVCDSVGKKAAAVEAMVRKLKLPVSVYGVRAENVLHDFRYHTLVSRAVGSLSKLLTWLEPHWASIGRLLVIKGPKWVEERGEARHRGLLRQLELRKLASYARPGNDEESVILELRMKGRGE